MTPLSASDDPDNLRDLGSPQAVSMAVQRLRELRERSMSSGVAVEEWEPNEQLTATVSHLRQMKQNLLRREQAQSARLILEGRRLVLDFLLQSDPRSI